MSIDPREAAQRRLDDRDKGLWLDEDLQLICLALLSVPSPSAPKVKATYMAERLRRTTEAMGWGHFDFVLAEAALDAIGAALSSRDEITKLQEALQFYADPFQAKDEFGEPVAVPDFYGELDFGARAQDALAGKDAADEKAGITQAQERSDGARPSSPSALPPPSDIRDALEELP